MKKSQFLRIMLVVVLIPLVTQFAGAVQNASASGEPVFTEINVALTGIYYSSVAWGDYDNDGDLDILSSGYDNSSVPITKLYRNDGNGLFVEVPTGLVNVGQGTVAWGDYNNDGNLDILIAGENNSNMLAKIYRNDGNGVFADINATLLGVAGSSGGWGDYDNDGDQDIVLTGCTGTVDVYCSGWAARIYRNDGEDIFTDINAGLMGAHGGTAAWGDYDNDGDLDLLLHGCIANWCAPAITKIYRNDGNGVFTDINAQLPAIEGSAAWGDYDNDGDLDILLAGSYLPAKVYRNDGNGIFTDIDAALTPIQYSSSAWGDYDNDGDLDILLTGWDDTYTPVAKVYRNNGDGTFTDINAYLTGVAFSSVAWGDYDNDGDLDILLTGCSDSLSGCPGSVAKIYRNGPVTDSTSPTITWIGNINDNDNFYFNFVPPAPICIATDDMSGLDGSCIVSGYASTVGTHTLTATAKDKAGNVATETRTYTVSAWTLKGFYQPVDMNGIYNLVKGGSTVPLKFEIFAGSTELTDTAYIKSLTYAETACNANAITDEIETTATGGTSLRYDATAGQFIYNWKTPKTPSKCFRVTMTTIDGSSLVAYFKLK